MRRLALLPLLALAPAASAQFDAGIASSQFDAHDVRAAAMGQAGAFLPDAAPLAFVQNPARLAEATVMPMLRVSLDGHPDFRAAPFEVDQGAGHLAASGTLGRVAVGAALSGSSETFAVTDEQGESLGDYEFGDRTLAVGAAVRLGTQRLSADLGVTGRMTRFRYPDGFDVGEIEARTTTKPALDLGAIVTADVLPARPLDVGGFAPTVAVSAGYAQRAIGPAFPFGEDDLGYSREQPRKGVAGTSVRLGLDGRYAGGRLRLVALDLAAEAEAALNTIDYGDGEQVPTTDRATLVGAMRVQDALLGTSDDATVEGQRGARLTVAESVWIAVGRYEGAYGDDEAYHTWGVGASVGGALRAAGAWLDDARAADLGRRFDVTLGVARGELNRDDLGGAYTYRLFTLGAAARL